MSIPRVSAALGAAWHEVILRPQHAVLGALVLGLLSGPRVPVAIVMAIAAVICLALPAPAGWVVAAALVGSSLFAAARAESVQRSHLGALVGHVYRGDMTLLKSARTTASGGWTTTARLGRDPVLVLASPRIAVTATTTSLSAGDIVGGLFSVAPADSFALAARAHATVRVLALQPTGRRRGGVAGTVDSLRRRAQSALDHDLPPPQAGLMRGMVLGDDTALPAGTRADFRASGLSHLMAASGQNVVLLVALAVAMASGLGIGFRVRWIGVLGLIAIYVPLAGGGASIQRAGVMGVAGVVALMAARPVEKGYALGLAAAVTLALDPCAATDPGWQMSFAAVIGLLLLAQPWSVRLQRRYPGMPAPLAEAFSVTAAATIATAPIIAAHFGTTSLVTLPANIAAAPVVAPIMWLGLLAAGIGQVAPVLAVPLDVVAAPLLGFLTWVAHAAASAPGSRLHVGAAPVVLGCGVLMVFAGRRRRLVGGGIALAAALGCAAVLALVLTKPDLAPLPAPAGLRMTFLDVGQGDATLLQDGASAVLIDTGPPDAPIVRLLRRAGIKRLAALVVTHAQSDHEGGAAAVLKAFPVGMVLDGRDGVPSTDGDRFAQAAAARRVRLVAPLAGTVLRAGRLALTVLNPKKGPSSGATGADPNQRAIVLELRDRAVTALFTADAESDVLAPLNLEHVDVLKVSHHGSADPGLPALLASLTPKLAVIEVGAHNTYGHPTAQVLGALRAVPNVFRTDADGTVRVDLGPQGLVVHRHS